MRAELTFANTLASEPLAEETAEETAEPTIRAEAEYSSLRQELRDISSQTFTIATFALTAAGGAILASFQVGNPIGALLPLFILYLGYAVVDNNGVTIARISTYLRLFWEERHRDYQWETRLSEYRDKINPAARARRGEPPCRDREEWDSHLVEKMFIWFGYLCLAVYAWMAFVKGLDQYTLLKSPGLSPELREKLMSNLMTREPLVNLVAMALVGTVAASAWTWFAVKSWKRRARMSGGEGVVAEMLDTWREVREWSRSRRGQN